MSDRKHITLFDSDPQRVERYRKAFDDAALGTFQVGYLPDGRIVSEPGFDALYWTLAAAERWNVRPVEGVVQLVETNADDRSAGWPRYLLVGLALNARDATTPQAELGAWSRAILKALEDPRAAKIDYVKAPMDMVLSDNVSPDEVARIFAAAERT